MAIRIRNASGLQLDEILSYEVGEPKTLEDLKNEAKGYADAPDDVKATWDAHFEKQLAEQENGDAVEENTELLYSLKTYISTLNGYLDSAKAARRATTITVLKELKPADYTKEKLDPIQQASGFISYHQLLGQIATHVDGTDRPTKAADQKARDWTAIEGIDQALVAKVAELAKVK